MRDYTHPAVIEECRLAALCCDAYQDLCQAECRMFEAPHNEALKQAADAALKTWRAASADLMEHRETRMQWAQDTPAGPIYLPV